MAARAECAIIHSAQAYSVTSISDRGNKMKVSVKKKHVVITAAAGGAGRTIAQAFAREGAAVAVCDIDTSALLALEKDCPKILCFDANAGDARELDAFLETAERAHGETQILINNAGIAGPTARVEEISNEDWNRVLAVNLSGFFYAIRRVVPAMRAAGSGCVINVSSGSARVGLPMRLPYVVAKSAILELTRTLARELGPDGIRVNAILPGWINNDRGRRVVVEKAQKLGVPEEELITEMSEFISLRRMVEPDDIAEMVLFLASERARMVTGQFIGVCGNVEYER